MHNFKSSQYFSPTPVCKERWASGSYSWFGNWRRKNNVRVWEKDWGHNFSLSSSLFPVFLLSLPELASVGIERPLGDIYTLNVQNQRKGVLDRYYVWIWEEKIQKTDNQLFSSLFQPRYVVYGSIHSKVFFFFFLTFVWGWDGGRCGGGSFAALEEGSPCPTPGYCQHLPGGQLHTNHKSSPSQQGHGVTGILWMMPYLFLVIPFFFLKTFTLL